MKKILLESHHLKNPFFGFGQFNHHLIKAMQQLDHEDMKLVIHGKDISTLKKEYGGKFDYKRYSSLRRYKSLRIREKYDLWHSLNQNTKIEPYHNIPYLLTIHNITYIKDQENYMQKEVHQRFQEKINRSTAVTYISEYAKTSTHRFFKVPDVPEYVIYNGNPIKEITLSEGFLPKVQVQSPYLFSIGEFTARKNFKSLVEMLKILPDYHLVLAGKNSTSYGQELSQLIKKYDFENRVHLVGKISDEEKQYYFQNCEAFVFPSLREGFGLPIIEAMKFGKPIFTSNNTSLPEIGADFVFYWDHYDNQYMAEVFKKGMKIFQKNEDLYKEKLISRAKSFSWDQAAKQYFEVYRSLLKK